MRTENPYFSAIRRADKIIGDNKRSNARWKKRCQSGKEYLDSEHLFKLVNCADNSDLGETMTMTGRVARETNNALRDVFREELAVEIQAGVPFGKTASVMKRWVAVKESKNEETV